MATSEVIYLGGLRAEAIHLKSGNKIITDAPTDNHGRGEAFSPTDLVATALANCAITVMGIYAENEGIDISGTQATVLKVMGSEPRRISAIEIEMVIVDRGLTDKQKQILINTAKTCPVAKSLHPDLVQKLEISFKAE